MILRKPELKNQQPVECFEWVAFLDCMSSLPPIKRFPPWQNLLPLFKYKVTLGGVITLYWIRLPKYGHKTPVYNNINKLKQLVILAP